MAAESVVAEWDMAVDSVAVGLVIWPWDGPVASLRFTPWGSAAAELSSTMAFVPGTGSSVTALRSSELARPTGTDITTSATSVCGRPTAGAGDTPATTDGGDQSVARFSPIARKNASLTGVLGTASFAQSWSTSFRCTRFGKKSGWSGNSTVY